MAWNMGALLIPKDRVTFMSESPTDINSNFALNKDKSAIGSTHNSIQRLSLACEFLEASKELFA